MSGPLDGIRIVDLTSMLSGPFATMMLGDQGADVIKVEPLGGDHVRALGNRSNGMSASLLNSNRSKRSIAVDLRNPEGREVVRKLAQASDVFVQNFRPGVIERLGLGEQDLLKLCPRLIYASISGFGESGPYASKPTYDPIVQALSGLVTIQGGADDARPRLIRTVLVDKLTAITAAQAISSALVARERTGQGQAVRLSMLDAVMSFLWASDMGAQTYVGREVTQQAAATFIDLIYQTKDGYITVAIMADKQWTAFCKAVGREDLLSDPRFETPALRDQHVNDRLSAMQEVLQHRGTSEWVEILEAAAVPCAPVLKRKEIINHPQVKASGSLIEYDHPVAGRLRQARPAARFSGTPPEIRRGAPALGEHTTEVLAQIGYSETDVARLVEAGVVANPATTPS
ncbi:MAG: CoA transferase [Betaproteobacteria bacterium]|nr:CoA transferase [Betaproteobacteria bacterium]